MKKEKTGLEKIKRVFIRNMCIGVFALITFMLTIGWCAYSLATGFGFEFGSKGLLIALTAIISVALCLIVYFICYKSKQYKFDVKLEKLDR